MKILSLLLLINIYGYAGDSSVINVAFDLNATKKSKAAEKAVSKILAYLNEAGIRYKVKNMPVDRIKQSFKNGEIDIDLLRVKAVDWSKHYSNAISISNPIKERIYIISTQFDVSKLDSFKEIKEKKFKIASPRGFEFVKLLIDEESIYHINKFHQERFLLDRKRVDGILASESDTYKFLNLYRNKKQKLYVGPKKPYTIEFVSFIRKEVKDLILPKLKNVMKVEIVHDL